MSNFKVYVEGQMNTIILLCTFIFTICIMTLKTFMSSDLIDLTLLSLTLVLLIFYYMLGNNSITIYRHEFLWFVFLFYF